MLTSDFLKHCDGKAIVVIGVGLISVYRLSYVALRWKKQQKFFTKSVEARENRNASFQQKYEETNKIDTETRRKILSMTSTDLISMAQNGTLAPVDILLAYFHKACQTTSVVNCLTGLIQEADQQSQNLMSGSVNPSEMPLYGLPVSLKECIQTQGMDSTTGVSCYIGSPAEDDSVLAKVLKHCGAIPFVKTNIPQLMLCFGSSNPIFGETGNPHNVRLTPGGSSAGESSLIGAGGSLLGFGTDIAGSIRNPAHMCGITGLKPTLNRISKFGIKGSLPGQTLITSTVGPMARDVDTLVLAMRSLLCPLMFHLDNQVPPLPFNEKIFSSKRPLRIGYYFTDGYFEPVPAVQRAVKLAKAALEKAGHTMVPFSVPRIEDAVRILLSGIFADGGKKISKKLKYCQVDDRIKQNYRKWRCPSFLRYILTFFIGLKSPRKAKHWQWMSGGKRSVSGLWNLQVEISQYKQDFFQLWKEQVGNLDAIICPPFPMAAAACGSIAEDLDIMSYTALYNLLNCPAGVVPVTKVSKSDIDDLQNYRGHFGDSWDKAIKKASTESLGMPVGVQCAALPWQEEMCLRVMKEIESAFAQ